MKNAQRLIKGQECRREKDRKNRAGARQKVRWTIFTHALTETQVPIFTATLHSRAVGALWWSQTCLASGGFSSMFPLTAKKPCHLVIIMRKSVSRSTSKQVCSYVWRALTNKSGRARGEGQDGMMAQSDGSTHRFKPDRMSSLCSSVTFGDFFFDKF